MTTLNAFDVTLQHPTATTMLAGVWLPKLILPWYGKVFVCLVEAAGLAVAIYGCTKVYQVRLCTKVYGCTKVYQLRLH